MIELRDKDTGVTLGAISDAQPQSQPDTSTSAAVVTGRKAKRRANISRRNPAACRESLCRRATP